MATTTTTTLSPAGPIFVETFGHVGPEDHAACRGDDSADNSDTYYDAYASTNSLEECRGLCSREPECEGVEFTPLLEDGRCEVWTRLGGIASSKHMLGFTCLKRFRAWFEPVDGGADRACRGADSGDNDDAHYVAERGVPSLQACGRMCLEVEGCTG